MAKTNAEIKNAYAKRNYDDVRLQVKKGQKEVIRQYAESKGMSLNGYINSLIEADMKAQPVPCSADQNEQTGSLNETYRPIEELDLSVRTYNVLKRAGINTINDFLQTDQVSRIGQRAMLEVQEKIEEVK